jgi:hypothetical protein
MLILIHICLHPREHPSFVELVNSYELAPG